jgi:hypothetical protein
MMKELIEEMTNIDNYINNNPDALNVSTLIEIRNRISQFIEKHKKNLK